MNGTAVVVADPGKAFEALSALAMAPWANAVPVVAALMERIAFVTTRSLWKVLRIFFLTRSAVVIQWRIHGEPAGLQKMDPLRGYPAREVAIRWANPSWTEYPP